MRSFIVWSIGTVAVCFVCAQAGSAVDRWIHSDPQTARPAMAVHQGESAQMESGAK